MKRQIATIRVACLLPGLLLSGAWAQEGASPAKLDWSRKPIAVRVVRLADIGLPRLTGRYGFFSASGRLPTLPGSGFIRLGYLPYPRPLAVTPLTTDNWLGGSGTWNTTGDWSGGTPTSSSAVTIGNTSSGAVTVSQAGAASAANVSLLSGNTLNIAAANTLTVGGATTLAAGAVLGVGNGGSGGATLTSGGSLTNAGTMQIGSQYNSTASTVTVTGTYTGTGGTLQLYGGNASGSNALLNISGAAAGTLTGTYQIQSGTGSAAVEWGSGGITSIGDGVSNTGYLSLVGSTAYTEIGATNSDSALKTLATIASNGQLYLDNGASMTTIVALTNNGLLGVGNSDNGGSTLTIGGALTNTNLVQVGSQYMADPSTIDVTGTLTNTGGTVRVYGGNLAGSNSLLKMTGAAPSTLTGTYQVQSDTGSAAIEWGSGAITSIGDGVSNSGYLSLAGSAAYAEIGATNSDSALKTLATIASNGQLYLDNGASVTTTVALTNNGLLGVGNNDNGGSTLTIGGALTNTNLIQIGSQYMADPSTIDVTGTLTNTGGTVRLYGGNQAGSNALLNMTGAAPGTLTGTYQVQSDTGSAAVEWGSGAITSIGDGASNSGYLSLVGSTAYAEIGATNSDSALKTLATIAGNGQFYLDNGAALTTTVALTNNGQLGVGNSDNGGSTLTIGGALINTNLIQVGNPYMADPSAIDVTGALTNTGGTVRLYGGNQTGSNALLNMTGAAPGTLTGTYQLQSETGSAAVEWGSGAITSIGDGVSNAGYLSLVGSTAYAEIGATNSDSALKTLATIASNGQLYLDNGASLTSTVALINNGQLGVGNSDNGGSTMTIGGALTNTNLVQVGNTYMASASAIDVTGALTNTGGTVRVYGGDQTGSNSLLDVTGAAPGALTGTYQVQSDAGSAAVEWGSGAITSIGNGTSNAGYLSLVGSTAYAEIGATNSDSALKTLATIASNGQLYLDNGASLATTVALTNNGTLGVGNSDNGGSTLTIGGSLTNTYSVQVGSGYMASPSAIDVTGTLTNTGGTVRVYGGNQTGANSLLDVTGAAPTTLTGTYQLQSSSGSAAVEWGSGGITSIGNGTSGGDVSLNGSSAYMETGATSSNSALKTLTTIAGDGELQLQNGASVTTTGALTVASGGQLQVDELGNGGSTMTVGATLTNSGYTQVGNQFTTSASAADIGKSLVNSSTGTIDVIGSTYAAVDALLKVTGPSLSNSGTINLEGGSLGDAELEINGNVTLSGTGKVVLSNVATNIITGTATSDTLTNSSMIEGSGTIENIGIVNTGTISANQSVPLLILPSSGGLNNTGTLSVSAGDTMQIGTSAGGALLNFSSTTLLGGTYTVGGTLQFGASGSSIVTDSANISLTGAGAQMINFGGQNLLTNLATITSAGSLTLGTSWGTFTTTGNFTNDGTLSVGAGDKFIVDSADTLTNFSSSTDTLTGGTYKITGLLEFKGANIVTNDASITLTGANSKIDSSSGANALANFAVNDAGASFSLGTGRSFTTAGNFTNNGLLSLAAGDTFDVNGNLTNFTGTALAGGAYYVGGTLQFNGADIVTNSANITLSSTTAKIVNQSAANALLGFNTNTAAGSFTLSGNASLSTTGGSFTNAGTVTVSSGSTFTIGGSSYNYTQTAGTTTVNGTLAGASTGNLYLNGGNLYGTGSLDYGVVDTATITPGTSATSTGELQVNGTYAQNSGGALDVTIGGTTAGTKFDQLNVSGTATLNGTLNITLASGYTPAVGNTFDILNASSVSGNFSTINGLAINSNEHFTVTTVSGDEIELTVVSGAAVANSVSLPQLSRAGLMHGRYGLGLYGGQLGAIGAPVVTRVLAPARGWSSTIGVSHTLATLASARAGGAAPVWGSMANMNRSGLPGFRPMDELGSATAPLAPGGAGDAGVAGALGISAVSAAAYNPMASMNHMRFECGVDLKALMKTSRKQLLKGLWAAPDSPDALNIGYMTLTTR
jgi:fibronectin-binding autotransporter adhesin